MERRQINEKKRLAPFYAVFAALVYGLGSAISVGSLLSPAELYTGGVTGLAQLLSALSGRLLPHGIPIYFLILAINIPLAVFAYFSLGKRFTLLSFLALGTSAMFLQLLPPLNITSDPLLCAVFGGVIGGCGMGLCFRAGFSTGGTDFIILYQKEDRQNGRRNRTRSERNNNCGSRAVLRNRACAVQPGRYLRRKQNHE